MRSEPHKISTPYHPKLEAFGVVHNGWRDDGATKQMGCGMLTTRWAKLDDTALVTCIWCITGYLPWLSWASPADPNRKA